MTKISISVALLWIIGFTAFLILILLPNANSVLQEISVVLAIIANAVVVTCVITLVNFLGKV